MDAEELRQRLTLIVAETPVHQCWTLSTMHLMKLVKDAVEAEREACAFACVEVGNSSALTGKQARVTTLCVEAILSRSEK